MLSLSESRYGDRDDAVAARLTGSHGAIKKTDGAEGGSCREMTTLAEIVPDAASMLAFEP